MPRLHVVMAVFKRNFFSYFASVLGYLFIIAFVSFSALVAFNATFFANNLASLAELNSQFPLLVIFIVPAITMTAWADEKKLGTEELLFTLPVSDIEVLLGKFAAVVAVYTVALLFSLTNVLFLTMLGEPDWGQIFSTYLGYWLAGVMLLSVGMVSSYLTSSATVAFVLGIVFCSGLLYTTYLPLGTVLEAIATVPAALGMKSTAQALAGSPEAITQFLQTLTVGYHLEPFGSGRFTWSNVLYFVGLTVVMLYINLVLIGRRHWYGGQRGTSMSGHYFARAVSLAVITTALFLMVDRISIVNAQVDLTAEKIFSVTPFTAKLLDNVSAKRPVLIQAFISREVPREYVPVKRQLLGLLDQYRRLGGGNITVRIVTVEPFSEEADQAQQFGIERRPVQSERGGRLQLDDVYLGAVINSGANEVVIPFFEVALPIEYELTRSIRTVANEKRKVVGILETDAKINGGFDMSTFRSTPETRFVTELKKQYDVQNVSASSPIDETKFEALIAVMPSSLNAGDMANFVDYVRKGKPTLILDDPLPAFNLPLAPKQPKPRAGGNPMMGGAPPEPKADGGKATSLVNLLGIQWNYDEIAFDHAVMRLHPEYADAVRPEMVAVARTAQNQSAFGEKNEITSGLQEVLLIFPGTIQPRENSKYNFEPLLRTNKLDSGLVGWDDLVDSNFFGVQIRDDLRYPQGTDAHVLAAKITGTNGNDRVNVVYVADADMISDWFFTVRERKLYNLNLDNVTFVLNAVDDLVGDPSFMALRKQRAKLRTLSRFDRVKEVYLRESNEERVKAADEAKAALESARERLGAEVKKIQADESLDEISKLQQLMMAQSTEERRIKVEEANIEQEKDRKLAVIKNRTERQVRLVEQRYTSLAAFLAPLPALLLGLWVWVVRKLNEEREIIPSRHV